MMTSRCANRSDGRWLIALGGLVWLSLLLVIQSKPMDAEAAKRIPELKNVLVSVRHTGKLSDLDRLVISTNLASGDPILISISACVLAESQGDESKLCSMAESVLKTAEAMPQAFLRLLLAKKTTEGRSASEHMAVIESFLKDTNPYLRIEAAKELNRCDDRKGEDALRVLLSSDSPIASGEAFRQLHRMGKVTDIMPVPLPDERYNLLLSIIEKAPIK